MHALIDATANGSVIRTDVFDRPPDERWGSGRVTLLGDAAHPMTFAVGQGAAQALEDALAVTDAVTTPADGIEAALRAYEQQRIPRAAKFQTMAWKLARAGTLNPPGTAIRDTFFTLSSPIAWRMQAKDMAVPV